MKHRLWVIALLLVVVLAAGQTPKATPFTPVHASTTMPPAAASPTITPELLADLDATFPAAMITFDIPGAAIALIQEGQVIYAKGCGCGTSAPVNPSRLTPCIGSHRRPSR
jgi:CubicO group peptidase (beta-lactamase class C family)